MQNCRSSTLSCARQSNITGGAVSLADLLERRSHGLTEPETWALLCQAVQALQDLFLSDSCGVGRCVPLVTPGSFLVTSRGRVSLPTQRRLTATPPQTAYLAPEYRPTKNYTDTESEKMWIFSLGETLTRTALTSHCAVTHLSPALCRALSAMTRQNPSQRANLMCLLDVISDYCKSRVQTKPFSHIVMDLHREVMGPIYHNSPTLYTPAAMNYLSPRATLSRNSEVIPQWAAAGGGTLPRQQTHQYTTYNRSNIPNSPTTMLYEPIQQQRYDRPKSAYYNDTTPNQHSPTSQYNPNNSLINQLMKFNDRTKEMNRNTLARFSPFVPDIAPTTPLSRHVSEPIVVEAINEEVIKRRKRNPIQRAASRLYKANDIPNSVNSHRPDGCVGPEFVVRSSLPSKQLEVGQCKNSSRKMITVILLNGQKLEVHCDPNTTTAGQIFEAVIQSENLKENFMLGLSALMTGDFIFLPSDTRVCKVVNQNALNQWTNLTLFLRVRLFLPSLRGLRGYQARHALYLQLRRSVLEQHLSCLNLKSLITLGGLALQAEFGDFLEKEHGKTEYFLLEHYVPETMLTESSSLTLRELLTKAHQARVGTDRDRAEQEFIQHAQSLPHYGAHFYAAVWVQKENQSNVWLCVTARGISLYERLTSGPLASNISPCQSFEWRFIQTLCYSKQYLCILPQPNGNKRPPKCKLKMDHKKSYFTFRLASLHHQFFLRLRTEYSSLQTLAQEFGIPLKTMKNETNALLQPDPQFKISDRTSSISSHESIKSRSRSKTKSGRCRRSRSATDIRNEGGKLPLEEFQNKENENPQKYFGSLGHRDGKNGLVLDSSMLLGGNGINSLTRENKRQGVLMGTRAIGNSYGLQNGHDTSRVECSGVGEAYVLNSTLRPSEDQLIPDFQETISDSLMEKFDKLSFVEERLLRSVTLKRNNVGSLGLQITEGSDGNVYVQSIIPNTPAEQCHCIHKGDQIIAVNGHSLLNMRYVDALNLLKQTGNTVEFVLSQITHTRQPTTPRKLKQRCLDRSRLSESMFNCSLIDRTMIHNPVDISAINYVDFSEDLTRSYHDSVESDYLKHLKYDTASEVDSIYSYKLSRRNLRASKSCGMLNDSRLYDKGPKISKSLEEFLYQNTDSEYLDDTLSEYLGDDDVASGNVAVPRSLGLSRKWKGPVRYPVTPARQGLVRKNSIGTSEDDTATYTVTSDEEQIFI